MTTRKLRLLKALTGALATVLLAGCSLPTAGGFVPTGQLAGPLKDIKSLDGATIAIGSKNFSENVLLGKMAIILLQSAGATVTDLTNIPGSAAARQAMINGQIQGMWEYTGTGWITYLTHEKPIPDEEKQYVAVRDEDLKKNKLAWTKPAPMNNTFGFAITKKSADKYKITKLSELKKVPVADRTFCAESELINRPDGIKGMLTKYDVPLGKSNGVPQKNLKTFQTGAIYDATAKGACNFGEVFTTDGRILALNFKVLEDDRNFFPKYNVALVLTEDVDKSYPQIEDLVAPVSEKLTNEVLLKLNAQIDVDGREPADVAYQWLRKEGFVTGKQEVPDVPAGIRRILRAMYRSTLLTAGSALALSALLLTGLSAGPSAADPVTVTPNFSTMQDGVSPLLPYVDVPKGEIVDGSRHVSISGLQGTVTALHKVDGGYVLARTFSTGDDLVMVRTSGSRKVLVSHWMQPDTRSLDPGLAVSHDASKVAVNVSTASDKNDYVETRVVSLPAGSVLHRRKFNFTPKLLGYGSTRVMVSSYPNTQWWTPSTGAAPRLATNAIGQSADLTAWQWAVRRSPPYRVQGIPPETSPDWQVAEEDIELGPWSPDDTAIAGNNEVTENFGGESSAYLVYRTSDGASLLSVLVPGYPQVTWETSSALLMLARSSETPSYQLIRCTLVGSCDKVGPSSTSKYGAIIPATRRNS